MKKLLFVLFAANCAASIDQTSECRRTDDCDAAFCIGGRCEFAPTTDLGPDAAPASRDLESPPADTRDPANTGPCAGALAADLGNLTLNEVLANVPPGEDGDANADGTRDAYEDEFIELVNVSLQPIDLGGVRIWSGGKLKHSFEPTCVLPGESIVVFGGGSVGAAVPGNALIADSRFSFPNDGGVVEVTTAAGTIDRLEYPRSDAASLTRAPQLRGPDWVNHHQLSSLPFSPGTCPDGRLFSSGCETPSGMDAVDAGVTD